MPPPPHASPAVAPPALSEEAWHALLEGAHPVHVRAGDAVVAAGAPPRAVAVVAGIVRLCVWVPGARPVTVRYAHAGDLIGLAAAVTASTAFSVEAATGATVVMLDVEDVRRVAAERPETAWAIIEALLKWTADAVRDLAMSGFAPARARVARHLLEVLVRAPDGGMAAHVTHQQVADAVGTAREVVSRVLGGLVAEGVVASERGRIAILDAGTLGRIADEPR